MSSSSNNKTWIEVATDVAALSSEGGTASERLAIIEGLLMGNDQFHANEKARMAKTYAAELEDAIKLATLRAEFKHKFETNVASRDTALGTMDDDSEDEDDDETGSNHAFLASNDTAADTTNDGKDKNDDGTGSNHDADAILYAEILAEREAFLASNDTAADTTDGDSEDEDDDGTGSNHDDDAILRAEISAELELLAIKHQVTDNLTKRSIDDAVEKGELKFMVELDKQGELKFMVELDKQEVFYEAELKKKEGSHAYAAALAEHKDKIGDLIKQLVVKDAEIEGLTEAVATKDKTIKDLTSDKAKFESAIESLNELKVGMTN